MKIRELFEDNTANDEYSKKWLAKWEESCLGNYEKYKREMSNYYIRGGGEIVFQGNVYILSSNFLQNDELPIQISECRRLLVATPEITSFKNFPKYIFGWSTSDEDFVLQLRKANSLDFFNKLTSLEGITPIVEGNVDLSKVPNLSYHNAHNYLHSIDGVLNISGKYEGPLLSVLMIKKLTSVISKNAWPLGKLEMACEIISKHLQSDGDILECQEELIDAGLQQYARL